MNDELIAAGALFIENREVFDRVFRMSDRYELSACALYMAVHGFAADEDKLRECRAILKQRTGAFSYLRETGYAATALMALSDDPESVLDRICCAYGALSGQLPRSSSLCIAAMMLAERANESEHGRIISAAHEQYYAFREKHRYRMSWHDGALCLLLAMRSALPEQSAEYADNCFRLLRRKPAFRCTWSLAQILSAEPHDAEARCEKARELKARIRGCFGRVSFDRELAALFLDIDGSLAHIDDAAAICDWLRTEKRFSAWHICREERIMLSFLLASPSDAMLCIASSLCLRKREEQYAAAASA